MPFYAVARGKNVGIYPTWDACSKEVKGIKSARYKKFNTRSEAEQFISENQTKSGSAHTSNAASSSSASTGVAAIARKRHATDSVASVYNKKSRLEKFGNVDWSDATIVYTDGACSNNGKSSAKAGYGVFWGEDSPDNEFGPVYGEPTNNRGELLAVKMALKKAVSKEEIKSLIIRTDSQLLIKSFDDWMPNWKKNNWMTASKHPVKNKDLLVDIDELLNKIPVKLEYVAAHVGIPGNEAADALARQGAVEFKKGRAP